jgi:hypothetical protein
LSRFHFIVFLLLCCAAGVYLRTFPRAYAPTRIIDMSLVNYVKSHRNLGDFAIEGIEDRDIFSLRLKSARCAEPLYLSHTDLFNLPPEGLTSSLYPPARWRIFRIRKDELYTPITGWELPGSLIRQKIGHLFLVKQNPFDYVIFIIAVPQSCTFGTKDAFDLVQSFKASLE